MNTILTVVSAIVYVGMLQSQIIDWQNGKEISEIISDMLPIIMFVETARRGWLTPLVVGFGLALYNFGDCHYASRFWVEIITGPVTIVEVFVYAIDQMLVYTGLIVYYIICLLIYINREKMAYDFHKVSMIVAPQDCK